MRQRRAADQPDSIVSRCPLKKLREDQRSTAVRNRRLAMAAGAPSEEAQDRGRRPPRASFSKVQSGALRGAGICLHLRDDVVQRLHSPPGRGAESQSLIEVAPLDNGNGAIAAVFACSLNVSLKIAEEPRPYIDASARETQRQMRFDKRLEMQRRASTDEMNARRPLAGAACPTICNASPRAQSHSTLCVENLEFCQAARNSRYNRWPMSIRVVTKFVLRRLSAPLLAQMDVRKWPRIAARVHDLVASGRRHSEPEPRPLRCGEHQHHSRPAGRGGRDSRQRRRMRRLSRKDPASASCLSPAPAAARNVYSVLIHSKDFPPKT